MGKFVLSKTSDRKQFYWTLKADNEEVIAVSQRYESKAAAQVGIDSVKRNAPGAAVIDITPYQAS